MGAFFDDPAWIGTMPWTDVAEGSLVEALSQGALPLYPKIDTGGDYYTRETSPGLLYPAGDISAAAEALQAVLSKSGDEIRTLRKRAQASVEPHSPAVYFRSIFDFAAQVREAPRVSTTEASTATRLSSFLNLSQIAQVSDLRGRLRR